MGELYGDLDQVKAMLRPTGSASFNADADARLAALRAAVSLAIEQKTNRVFGGNATATTRTIDGRPGYADDVLMLPAPIRSVGAVEIVGDYAETLDADAYLPWSVDANGDAHALLRLRGYLWPMRDGVNRIAVTAVWSDEANGGDVPADITYAANYLIAELFKIEQASPAGFTGPDGATIPIRDPWKQEMVKAAIAKHRAAVELLAF